VLLGTEVFAMDIMGIDDGCGVGGGYVALSLSSFMLPYVELVISNPVPVLWEYCEGDRMLDPK
jgi:hypothetical protein